MNFFFRQPGYCLKNPRKAWATRKAMQAYRKEHPVCEWSGRPGPVHVHHVQPIQYAPELAADPENFVSLAGKRVHLTVGHAGNYKDYVENVKALCKLVRVGKPKKED
jgi:hypothetical protein